jgi:hypothetical protein
MFPPSLLTSDFFLAYAHARLERCTELATTLRDKLAFVETAAYTTFLEREAEDAMPYSEYRKQIEGINDVLRSIECAMPALHRPARAAAPEPTDLSVALRGQCEAVRDLVPPLLDLGLPEVNAVLLSPYDRLERELEHVAALQHRVLIVLPILRSQFMRSEEYVEQWNVCVGQCSFQEVIFIVSAFENRLLRFRVNHYAVHDAEGSRASSLAA